LQGEGSLLILVSSDFHGSSYAFQKVAAKSKQLEVDILVVCGDITNFGTAKQAKELLSNLKELNLPVFFVPGNCDLPSVLEIETENCSNIHGKCVEISEYFFIGIGGSPLSPLQTPLEFPEEDISDMLEVAVPKCLQNKKLILVSHTPPFNTEVDLAFNGEHIGSRSVRNFVEKYRPLAVFCGHVHEARGIDKIGDTIVVNPGPARHGMYALAEINGEVKVKLDRFE